MTNNIFMISDASYCGITKCAGLGVIDLHTNKKYSHSLCNIKNSSIAEYRALFLSIYIAIENKYENVVFVYDDQSLKLDTLKLWLVDKIKSYQFLWLKRAYVDEADKLAKKARTLQETLIASKSSSVLIEDDNLLQIFRQYSKTKIITAFIHIATKDEAIILKTHIKNQKYSPVLVDEDSIDFYSDIYHLLSKAKSKKSFLKYIDKNYSKTINMDKFLTVKSDEHYLKLIKKMISRLNMKKPNKTKQSNILKKATKGLKDAALVSAVKKHPINSIVNFCATIGTKNDKKLLHGYFNNIKVDAHTFDENGIQLYMLIYSLLPKARQNNFYWFIKKHINNKNLEKKFVKSQDIAFQATMLKKIIAHKRI